MSPPSIGETLFHGRLRSASRGMFWLGVLLVVLGAAAIAFPIFSTFAATLLVGWVLLVSGLLALFAAFSIHGTGPFFAALVFSLLSIGIGVYFLVNPLAGAVILTFAVGAMLMLQGAFEFVFALEMRPFPGWRGMFLSGLASIAVAIIIIAGWPDISLVVLGLLLGINFLSTGIGYILASRAFKP